jgi:HEAT repeat protein
MAEQPADLKKLATYAADLELSSEMRIKAVQLLGRIGSREALLALLELAANERLVPGERDAALKQARTIIRSGR